METDKGNSIPLIPLRFHVCVHADGTFGVWDGLENRPIRRRTNFELFRTPYREIAEVVSDSHNATYLKEI